MTRFTPKKTRKSLEILVLGLSTLFLVSACGSSGGKSEKGLTQISSATPTAPATPVAPTLTFGLGMKQLLFNWAPVGDADYYRLLEDPDGYSGYTQIGGDLTTTVYDHDIALYLHPTARYILEACNSGGCTASDMVDVTGALAVASGYFKASNTGANDQFGISVALSSDGKTFAVGAYLEDSNATGINGDEANNRRGNSGAVYVFSHDGSSWSQQAYVKASNAGRNDRFGISISLSDDGNTLAVGAYFEDSNATGINGDGTNNGAGNSGAVYVFTRSGSTWTQDAYVKASNTQASDLFGYAVALSGDGKRLAVGGYLEDSNATGINGDETDSSVRDSGAVYVFTHDGSSWSQQAYVKASNTGRNDRFGFSVALNSDGNTLAVGVYQEDSNATGIDGDETNNRAGNSGAVYVFSHDGSSWSQQAYVKASNTGRNDRFGFSVALNSDGNTLAVGAQREESSSGAAYVYTRTGAIWDEEAYVKAANADASDYFGHAVTLSSDGNTLAVGAWQEDSSATGINGDQFDAGAAQSGGAYVFTRSASAWTQKAYVKASNTEANDRFGIAVALSDDGNTLSVGANYEQSNATGIGDDQSNNAATRSGAVYLY